MQAADAVDAQLRAADAADVGPHLEEELAQLDDVRLGGRVADLGVAARRDGGEERGLGAGHRRFLEIHRCPPQAVGRLERVVLSALVARAHGQQRVEVRRDAAPRGKITAGRRDAGAAAAREQRTEQQHRPAQPADQRTIGSLRANRRRADPQRGRADALDLGTDVEQQARHHLDVADARHVGEHALVLAQQAGNEQRQRRVLVALDRDAALQAMASLDEQTRHQTSRCGGRDTLRHDISLTGRQGRSPAGVTAWAPFMGRRIPLPAGTARRHRCRTRRTPARGAARRRTGRAPRA